MPLGKNRFKRTQPWQALLTLPLFLGLGGCGSTPINVTLDSEPNPWTDSPITYAVISAKVDEVKIKKVTVNRGNCVIRGYSSRGGKLSFGQQIKAQLGCDADVVKEISVETDSDTYDFSF